jgi:hypothetical protein
MNQEDTGNEISELHRHLAHTVAPGVELTWRSRSGMSAPAGGGGGIFILECAKGHV